MSEPNAIFLSIKDRKFLRKFLDQKLYLKGKLDCLNEIGYDAQHVNRVMLEITSVEGSISAIIQLNADGHPGKWELDPTLEFLKRIE